MGFSLVEASRGHSLVVRGLLTAAASLVVEHWIQSEGSIVVAPGLSCSEACGILLDQGSNPCLLVWEDPTCHGATKSKRHN